MVVLLEGRRDAITNPAAAILAAGWANIAIDGKRPTTAKRQG
jgi:hypothetical protein